MTTLATRLHSFRTPWTSLGLLILGLFLQFVAPRWPTATATAARASIAALDSAIAHALPAPGDTTAGSDTSIFTLIAQKRDAELRLHRASDLSTYLWFSGALLVGGSIIIGLLAVIAHLRSSTN